MFKQVIFSVGVILTSIQTIHATELAPGNKDEYIEFDRPASGDIGEGASGKFFYPKSELNDQKLYFNCVNGELWAVDLSKEGDIEKALARVSATTKRGTNFFVRFLKNEEIKEGNYLPGTTRLIGNFTEARSNASDPAGVTKSAEMKPYLDFAKNDNYDPANEDSRLTSKESGFIQILGDETISCRWQRKATCDDVNFFVLPDSLSVEGAPYPVGSKDDCVATLTYSGAKYGTSESGARLNKLSYSLEAVGSNKPAFVSQGYYVGLTEDYIRSWGGLVFEGRLQDWTKKEWNLVRNSLHEKVEIGPMGSLIGDFEFVKCDNK